MSAFLIDEMFPLASAELLRDVHEYDARHVFELGLAATPDAEIASTARQQGPAVVTENVADFASERDIVMVFVLKKNLAAGRAQAKSLATTLDEWARANPRPYLGAHWPRPA